jgi:hypothetical protein
MRRIVLALVTVLRTGCTASPTPLATQPVPAATAAPAATVAPSVAAPASAMPTSAAASPTPAPHATPTPGPHELGVGVSVPTAGGGHATVGVVTDVKRSSCGTTAPPAGDVFVVVSVGYAADAGPITYGPADWRVRDLYGSEYPAIGVACLSGPLGTGTLQQGTDAGGWITFAIPVDASHAWIDFRATPAAAESWRLW